MKNSIPICMVITLGIFLGCSSSKKTETEAVSDTIQLGDIQLETLEGQKIELVHYEGKTIFINFWATWCKPCLQEMPSIEKAMSMVNPDEVVFLFPSNETIAEISAFKEKHAFPFTYVQVKNLEALNFYALPTTLIFDPSGKLIFSEVGFRDWSLPENLSILDTRH
jgi:thiol-disulfide isomerase/thioredoxin